MLMSSSDNAATLQYGASSFRVLRPGQHVICAVSGAVIPLEELRYWSAQHQEAYASCEIATRRLMGEE